MTPSGTPLIFENVSKSFGHSGKGRVTALDRFSLSVRRGTITALLGPNGAGKTTAISLLLGLLAPSAGRVEVLGSSPRNQAVRQRIGCMPQESAIPAALTVRETLTLFASFYPAPLPVSEALALADLAGLSKRRAGQLSGGQKRRLAFALSVIGNPELLLIDEPTTGMDAQSRAAFWEGMAALKAEGRSILLTTHYLEEAERSADHVAVMGRGRLLKEGGVQQLRAEAGGARLAFDSDLVHTELERLPGVRAVGVQGRRATLHTDTPEEVLAALVQSGVAFTRLEVAQATLEDAYLGLLESHANAPA